MSVSSTVCIPGPTACVFVVVRLCIYCSVLGKHPHPGKRPWALYHDPVFHNLIPKPHHDSWFCKLSNRMIICIGLYWSMCGHMMVRATKKALQCSRPSPRVCGGVWKRDYVFHYPGCLPNLCTGRLLSAKLCIELVGGVNARS